MEALRREAELPGAQVNSLERMYEVSQCARDLIVREPFASLAEAVLGEDCHMMAQSYIRTEARPASSVSPPAPDTGVRPEIGEMNPDDAGGGCAAIFALLCSLLRLTMRRCAQGMLTMASCSLYRTTFQRTRRTSRRPCSCCRCSCC